MRSILTGVPGSIGSPLERACQSSPRTKTRPVGTSLWRTMPVCPSSSLLPVTTGAFRTCTILNATRAMTAASVPAIASTAGSDTS